MSNPVVLLVEPSDVIRRAIGSWLEREAYDVMSCPGPGEPDYVCIATTGRLCPLAHGADVVVLDLHQRSDAVEAGTPGWQLLLYYFEQGKNIVALTGDEDAVHPMPDDRVAVVTRPADRESLLAALRRVTPSDKGGARHGHGLTS